MGGFESKLDLSPARVGKPISRRQANSIQQRIAQCAESCLTRDYFGSTTALAAAGFNTVVHLQHRILARGQCSTGLLKVIVGVLMGLASFSVP
jgi:hypothetical protein